MQKQYAQVINTDVIIVDLSINDGIDPFIKVVKDLSQVEQYAHRKFLAIWTTDEKKIIIVLEPLEV